MRPLPVEPIGRSDDPALALIDGVAMIRGAAVPVVDARRLLAGGAGLAGDGAPRFVVVRTVDRHVAVRVDAVIELQRIDGHVLASLPPLLDAANRAGVAAIGARDDGLLVVLDAARVVPDASWRALATARGLPELPASDAP